MNLAFSQDEETMRAELQRVLTASSARSGLERIQRERAVCDALLWRVLAQTGWLAAGVPEAFGGSGLPPSTLCVLAEEIGRHAAAIPYTASVCGFAVGVARAEAPDAQAQWLPRIAEGSAVGIVLLDDDWRAPPRLDAHNRLQGATHCVGDGAAARVALVRCDNAVALVELPRAERPPMLDRTLDLLHPPAAFVFDAQPATVLARDTAAQALWRELTDRYALYRAFEQLGGAQAALQMARDYSLTRYAFGRAIGSFQALKHAMADMLAAIEIARANCCYGAAALAVGGDTLAETAAVARISATEAYRLCARQNQQIHGGIGVTWESDAHLHYRRAQALAISPGTPAYWKERLVGLLRARGERLLS
jgi:acyl-CoA dehydrogenase